MSHLFQNTKKNLSTYGRLNKGPELFLRHPRLHTLKNWGKCEKIDCRKVKIISENRTDQITTKAQINQFELVDLRTALKFLVLQGRINFKNFDF